MIQRDVGKVPRKPKEKSIPLTSKRITVGLLGNGIDFLGLSLDREDVTTLPTKLTFPTPASKVHLGWRWNHESEFWMEG